MTDREPIYHAAVEAQWRERTPDHYQPSAYAEEGFVHLSSAGQLVDTLHRYYPGRHDLILLTVDPAAVRAEVIWEDLYGSGIEYPHIYGPINLTAVVAATPLPCDEHGRFDWWRPA